MFDLDIHTNIKREQVIIQSLFNLDIDVFPGYYNFIHYYPPLNELPILKENGFWDNINSNRNIALYIHIP